MERSGLQFGAAYDIEEASPQKLREDFETMARAGMNLVRLGVDCFDREGLQRLCQAAEICRELGLRVILALPETGDVPEELRALPVDGFQVSASTPPDGIEPGRAGSASLPRAAAAVGLSPSGLRCQRTLLLALEFPVRPRV